MGQERRVEYKDNWNNGQNNLNGKIDLIVFDQILIAVTDLQYLVEQQIILSQMSYLLIVILGLNSISEVQYKKIMMIDNKQYQQ